MFHVSGQIKWSHITQVEREVTRDVCEFGVWSLVAAEEGPAAQDVFVGPMAGLEVTLSAGVVPAACGGGTRDAFENTLFAGKAYDRAFRKSVEVC